MSKSLGNVVAPQKVSDTLGAEILRLWVASDRLLGRAVDLRGDPRARGRGLSPLRNTLRFLLANTADFDSANGHAAAGRMAGDRPLRAGLDAPPAGAGDADYERFEFHKRRAGAAGTSAPKTWAPSTSTSSRTACTPPPPRTRRAALGAERAVAHPADADAPDGADPVLHRRGNLGDAEAGRQRDARHLACAAGAGRRVGAGGTVAGDPRSARERRQGAGRSADGRQDRIFATGRSHYPASGPVRSVGERWATTCDLCSSAQSGLTVKWPMRNGRVASCRPARMPSAALLALARGCRRGMPRIPISAVAA
jgi:hypothetical protein